MSNKKDNNNIKASVRPDQIDDEGVVNLEDGTRLELVDCRLIPPEGHKYVGVMMVFSRQNMVRPIAKCPNCNRYIPWECPLLLMEDSRFVFPCNHCEWVWVEQSVKMSDFNREWV